MMNADIMLGALGISIGVLMLVPDWRPAWALLCICGMLLVAFEQRELQSLTSASAATITTLLNAVNIVSLVCIALIVLFTGLTYNRESEPLGTDEVGKMHLRLAARRAANAVAPRGWNAYRLQLSALVLLIGGTWLLPLIYPAPLHTSAYAWTLLVLGGTLVAATSNTLLKLDIGLLLICFGLRLCYLTQAAAVGLFELAMFSIVPIVIALMMALLGSLLFARLGTLRLVHLFEQARRMTAPSSNLVDLQADTAVANEPG